MTATTRTRSTDRLTATARSYADALPLTTAARDFAEARRYAGIACRWTLNTAAPAALKAVTAAGRWTAETGLPLAARAAASVGLVALALTAVALACTVFLGYHAGRVLAWLTPRAIRLTCRSARWAAARAYHAAVALVAAVATLGTAVNDICEQTLRNLFAALATPAKRTA